MYNERNQALDFMSLFKVFSKRLASRFSKPEIPIDYDEIAKKDFVLACTDLGAFPKNLPKFEGIDAIVIMEDRLPRFFLEYEGYNAHADALLNRHGPLKNLSTQRDMKNLVRELQKQEIEVYLGFWGQFHGENKVTSDWMKAHPELKPFDSRSADVNPLTHLKKEGMSFAEYIGRQYRRIQRDFHFDGLFLGDGLNGYRIFFEPEAHRGKRNTAIQWNNYFQTIAGDVHRTGGKLLSYDCMGFAPEEAIMHGADYKSQAYAGLDYLVVQTYPHAWGEYWLSDKPGFDFVSAKDHLKRITNLLRGTRTKVLYTLELGDSVEKWHAPRDATLQQQQEFDQIAGGKMLVWANDIFAKRKNA